MLYRLLQRHTGAFFHSRRLTHFLFLMLCLTASQALSALLARSLFLDKVGPASLPVLFTITPLVLIMISTGFVGAINHISHMRLFRLVLLASILLILGLQALIAHHIPIIPYFAFYILSNILSVLLIKISFWTLASDYFTALEFKRYTAVLSLGANLGFLLANTFGSVVVRFVEPETLLLSLPLFYSVALIQLFGLERDQKSIEIHPYDAVDQTQGLLESLAVFPQITKRYPIIFFLSASSLIILLLRLLTEFQFSTIYAEKFTRDQDLTSFLGTSAAVFSLVQFVLISVVTTPFLQKLGVSRANLVYPLTTLASFIGLAMNFGFPTALAANLNHVAIYRSLADPVRTLNYNAVPPRALGTFRVLSEGLFSPLGEILGGMMLLGLMMSGTSIFVSLIGVGLSLVLVILSYFIGQYYVRSLMKMLTAGSVNLNDVRRGLTLPSEYAPEVRQLLNSDDRNAQILGLELAAYVQPRHQFLPQINALITNADRTLKQAIIKFVSQTPYSLQIEYTQQLLASQNKTPKVIALELLIKQKQVIPKEKIPTLLSDESEEIKALTCLALTSGQKNLNFKLKKICQKLWQRGASYPISKAIVDAISSTGKREFIPILCQILPQASSEVKRDGLKALVSLANPNDHAVREIAAAELGHLDPEVRAAALKLLGVIRTPDLLPYLASGLQDSDYHVRTQAASAIAAYGEISLPLIEKCLKSWSPEVVEAAIVTLGYIGTQRAENILFNYLSPYLQQLSQTWEWQNKIPRDHPSWKMLAIAVQDFHDRMIERVFQILSSFGCEHTLNSVRVLRHSTDKRSRANAVETVASLRYRRFVLPILPLLEQWASEDQPQPEITLDAEWMKIQGYEVLLEALECKDRWIEMGAIVALASLPSLLIQMPDPLVQEVVQRVFQPQTQLSLSPDFFMNRILLLKQVSLFQHISLDELLVINQELVQEEFLAGETILTEGSVGTHLYIISQGQICIVKEIEGCQQAIKCLSEGDYFGEFQLFTESPSSVGAIASRDCTVLMLEKSRLLSLTYQRPQILIEIAKQLSSIIEELVEFSHR